MLSRTTWKLTLVTITCFGVMFPLSERSKMQPKPAQASRVSPDLLPRIRRDGGSGRGTVIVQFNDSPVSQIDQLLLSYGARVMRRLNKLNMRVVELPLNAIEALASRPEVR